MSTRPEIPHYLDDRLMLVALVYGRHVADKIDSPVACLARLTAGEYIEGGEPTEKGRLAVVEIERLAVGPYKRPASVYPTRAYVEKFPLRQS